jgi:hypothetical protein
MEYYTYTDHFPFTDIPHFFLSAAIVSVLFAWMVKRQKKILFPYFACSSLLFYYSLLTAYFWKMADSASVRAVERRISPGSYVAVCAGVFFVAAAAKLAVAFLADPGQRTWSGRKVFLRCGLIGGGILTACLTAFVFTLRREGGLTWAVAFLSEWGFLCFISLAAGLFFLDYALLNRFGNGLRNGELGGDKKTNCNLAVAMNVVMLGLLLLFNLFNLWLKKR